LIRPIEFCNCFFDLSAEHPFILATVSVKVSELLSKQLGQHVGSDLKQALGREVGRMYVLRRITFAELDLNFALILGYRETERTSEFLGLAVALELHYRMLGLRRRRALSQHTTSDDLGEFLCHVTI
jgi:hypothetical protein